jgi:single-strand DNA-binding protein
MAASDQGGPDRQAQGTKTMLMNNLVMLKGRLGADAEIRTTTGGDRVANLRVVTTDTYKDKGGEWKEKAEWHRVTVWGEGSIKHLEKRGTKGAMIDVLGQNRTRKWTADGVDHYSTEVVADFRAGGEVKITTLAKGANEQAEPGEDQAA